MKKYDELLAALDNGIVESDTANEAAAVIRELLSKRTMYDDVANFHTKFNIPVAGSTVCRMPAYDIIEYRLKFLKEELQEFETACEAGSLVDAFDALLDIAWVAMGTAHYFGAPWEEGWAEVVRANMDRILVTRENCPPEKRYRKDMVMKPPGWKEPDLLRVIREHNLAVKRGEKPLDIPQFLRQNITVDNQVLSGCAVRAAAQLDFETEVAKIDEQLGGTLEVGRGNVADGGDLNFAPDNVLEEFTVSEKELTDVGNLGPEFHPFACTCELCIPTTDEATGD